MMKILKNFIRQVLAEDLESFVKDTQGMIYATGSSADLEFDRVAMNFAKKVKRAWAKNADHTFMKSLNKVHWFETHSRIVSRFKWFLDNPGKDEVSTSAYRPGEPLVSQWGNIGVLLDGHVTLAANDMNSVISGYAEQYLPNTKEWYKSSGIPKRAGVFNVPFAPSTDYVLDSSSFNPVSHSDNEFIVDNWKVKALVIGRRTRGLEAEEVVKIAEENGIPVITEEGKNVM